MSIEARLQKARLGIAAATAGLGMILGGCGTTVHWDNVQKLGTLGLGVVGGANATTPLQAAAADLIVMTAQNQIYHDQQMQVAQAGRTEVNVYGVQQGNIQPTSPPVQPMYAAQPRFINAYRTRDLNGNGVGEFLEELISANGEFVENDIITIRASNRKLPGTTIKLRLETNDPVNGWQILGETAYVSLPANEEQYWGYPARELGIGNKRATIYEARMGSGDIPIGTTYFNVRNSEGAVTKLNENTISSMEARKNTL